MGRDPIDIPDGDMSNHKCRVGPSFLLLLLLAPKGYIHITFRRSKSGVSVCQESGVAGGHWYLCTARLSMMVYANEEPLVLALDDN